MQPRRIATILIASCGLGIGCLSLLGGCTDESKKDGTQVQLTPEDEEFIKSMRGEMKQQRIASKKAQTEDNRKKKAE